MELRKQALERSYRTGQQRSTQLSSRAQSTMRSGRRVRNASIGIEDIRIQDAEKSAMPTSMIEGSTMRESLAQVSQKASINHVFNKEVLMDTPLELQVSKYKNFQQQYGSIFAATERFQSGMDGLVGRPVTQGSPQINRLNQYSRKAQRIQKYLKE